MKHYLLIIMAAVLFSTMASSCGKKTDETNMVKKDTVGPPVTPSVNISVATMSGSTTQGLVITAGNTSTTSASINVTDTSGTTTYKWRAYYGTANDSTLIPGNPSGGNSATWNPGSYQPLPQYWFPQYTSYSGPPPIPSAMWNNFSGINITAASGKTCTAYGVVTGNTNANIRIEVQAGSGEPGK